MGSIDRRSPFNVAGARCPIAITLAGGPVPYRHHTGGGPGALPLRIGTLPPRGIVRGRIASLEIEEPGSPLRKS